MDPTFFPWHFESTSTSDTDHDSEMSEEAISNSSTGLLAVILFILRHHLTTALGDLIALLNFLSSNLVVPFKYLSDKIPALSTVFYCHVCQNYMGKNPDDASCSHCGTMFNKKSSTKSGHFFLSASLKDLLKDILKNHGTELLPKTVNHANNIKDVMDGKMYQNLLKQGKLAAEDLTLLWNCDEVPIYNSSRYSIWPLQFTINEFPYTQRHVIVAGLWFGPEKPKMGTFLKPFIDESRALAQNPFQWSDSNGTVHSSKVFSLVCSSDAVARPLLRNCKQFNGEYGCDWCLHPGMMVTKGGGSMRSYPFDENKQAARSTEMFMDNAKQAENSATPKNGVKGLSLLSILPLFDIVFGFVPDYMHSVLLGVSKQLVTLWLDPVNSMKPWFIGQKISLMDLRLLRLKPPLEITRSPRSLKCRDTWKASEWRAFLLFYAISVLPGILDPIYLEHYFDLSFSIHILLQESISQHDLRLAHESLVRFVECMKVLYGEENVSFNCHQLIHLTESVQNWGPLWATSAFPFEKNNGNLRALLNGINDNPQQIYQRFVIWQHLPRHLSSLVFDRQSDFGELLAKLTPAKDGSRSDKLLGKSRHLDLTGSTKLAVEELLKHPVLVKSVEAYDSFSNGHTVYHSTDFKESDKTDCNIKLKNGCCGEIQLILLFKKKCICTSTCLCQAIPIIVVHLYDIKPDTLFSKIHPDKTLKTTFVRVERTDQPKAFFLEDIKCKCMYVDGSLVPLPNTYERY
ncbi:uncharacterized protein LOC119889661 [Micropterus salmoides]|uniref:uncharacterized protein LOC119889661 n=1 Tax=Micropterus salmoides TaxID=27706 RepID=UPI0018EB0A74|nr:uncharacterized protein LOC119889661 [Micropterus salmoides]